MNDKMAEHTLVFILMLCGLLLARILSATSFRERYSSIRQHSRAGLTLEIAGLVLLFSITMVGMPAVDLLTPWLDAVDFDFIGWVAWLGVAIGTAAVLLLWRAHYDLLRFLNQPESRHHFIETGVYRFIRHPFYAVMLLLAIAQTLMLQNWVGGPLAIATFLIVYILRIPVDEQSAMERYGYSYLDYMDRTNSLMPRLFSRQH